MKHVARVFNDHVGVELVERTGRNPQNVFVQLGCSKAAENRMLNYVRQKCVGKPFSNMAMIRSLIWPRETDHTSFFCAELVASVLKVGGLLDANCNPGSATPEMLHRIYAPRGAVSANPCVLREMSAVSQQATNFIGNVSHCESLSEREFLVPNADSVPASIAVSPQYMFQPARRRAESPPRAHFHAVTQNFAFRDTGRSSACSSRYISNTGGVQLTMDSLKFGGTKQVPR